MLFYRFTVVECVRVCVCVAGVGPYGCVSECIRMQALVCDKCIKRLETETLKLNITFVT